MKLIKFDLLINGIKIKAVEELRDNFADEIVVIFKSGQLGRWLKSRNLNDLYAAVENISTESISDKDLLVKLCGIFDIEIHEDDLLVIYGVLRNAGHRVGDTSSQEEKSTITSKVILSNHVAEYLSNYIAKSLGHKK
jgi:hypothetical protein